MVWNLVALEPDADRWLVIRPLLAQLGYRAVAVQDVRALESVVDAYDVDVVLIRPVGKISEHCRLAALLRKTGTRVFVTAEVSRPRILSLYYALGEQTRTLRPEPRQLGLDILHHAQERIDLLPPIPEFGQPMHAANTVAAAPKHAAANSMAPKPKSTERSPSRPGTNSDRIATEMLESIRLPTSAVG